MLRLKADLHLHSFYDPEDGNHPRMLTPKQLIKYAYLKGYRVLSITHHNDSFQSRYLNDFAKELGIILIPGVEITLPKGAHILLYNFKNTNEIKYFSQIYSLKNKDNLVVAPHPYFLFSSLGRLFEKNLAVFDAAEYSHFYLKWLNPNRKMAKIANRRSIPIIGSSDAHIPEQIGTTYSYIDVDEASIEGVIGAIKRGKVKSVSTPLSLSQYFNIIRFFTDTKYLKNKYLPFLSKLQPSAEI